MLTFELTIRPFFPLVKEVLSVCTQKQALDLPDNRIAAKRKTHSSFRTVGFSHFLIAQRIMSLPDSTATEHFRSEAPPCVGTGHLLPSALAGFPVGPHNRLSEQQYGLPRPQYASGGR